VFGAAVNEAVDEACVGLEPGSVFFSALPRSGVAAGGSTRAGPVGSGSSIRGAGGDVISVSVRAGG